MVPAGQDGPYMSGDLRAYGAASRTFPVSDAETTGKPTANQRAVPAQAPPATRPTTPSAGRKADASMRTVAAPPARASTRPVVRTARRPTPPTPAQEEAQAAVEAAPDTVDVPSAPGTGDAMDVVVAAEVLRRVNRTRHVVSLVSQAIIRSYDEEALYHEVCRYLVNSGGYLMAWVGLVDRETKSIRPVGHAGIEANFLQALKVTWANDLAGHGPTGEAVTELRPAVARNIPTDPRLEVLRNEARLFGYRATCALPLQLGNHGEGVLTIHALEPEAFGFEEVAFLRELAGDLAAGAIALREKAKRRFTEDAARTAEARYRSIIENAYEGIFQCDLEGRLLLVNDALVRLLGYPSQAALLAVDPPTIATHLHPQDAEPTVEGMLRYAGPEPIKARMRHQRGDWVWVSMSVKVIEGPSGTIIEGFIQDMTAVHGEQEARARLAAIIDSADDAIIGTDTDGRVSHWNQGAARLFGFSREEVLDRSIADFLVPSDFQSAWAAIQATIERGDRLPPFETVRQAKDGRLLHTSVKVSPIIGHDDTIAGATVVERDITQAQKAAAAKRAMELEQAEVARLKGLEEVRKVFISEASHELNTPLTPLRIHVEALRESAELSQQDRDHVVVIERNTRRLANLVHDMLDASRLDTGRFNLQLTDLPLAIRVGDAVDSLMEAAKGSGVTLECGPMARPLVNADGPRVDQVLYNLLNNAISFTPQGGRVTVSVSLMAGEAVVRVTDTGLGLSAEQVQQLFKPFSRPHEGTGSGPRGTGLGLFICKGIIEQHGGRIWAESPGPGKGSTFCFSLPLAKDSPGPPSPADPQAAPAGVVGHGLVGTRKTRKAEAVEGEAPRSGHPT